MSQSKPQLERAASTRSHEHEVTIDATPEAVWKAITQAEEIVNWFSLQAESKPVVGGEIVYRWGEMRWPCRIESLEPGRRLRTTYPEAAADGEPAAGASSPLAVDWYLEGRGGTTVLRLVHSGFGRDARFDDEYEGTRRGWDFELRSLKHFLERHAGRSRAAFWLPVPTPHSAEETWRRITSSKALVRDVSIQGRKPGDRYRLAFATGETIDGVVWANEPPIHFEGTAENHGDGLFRLGFESCFGKTVAYLGFSSWRSTREAVSEIETHWRGALERALA
jgi:uncharacterized protein YndB with AHSA1/START domain